MLIGSLMKNSAELALVSICSIGDKDIVLSLDTGESADSYHAYIAQSNIELDPTWKFTFDWVKPGDTVIDLGANLGTFSVPLAAKGATVYGFEMLEANISHLKRSIEQNNLSTLHVVEGAVSDKPGYLGTSGTSAWGTVSDNSPDKVLAIVLDEWANEVGLEKLDFMKIDIEGSEMAALRGARSMITKFKPDMVIEANVMTCGHAGYGYPELIAFMAELGYRSYRIANGRINESARDPQPSLVTDYFFSAKPKKDVEERSPVAIGTLSLQEVIDTVVAQDNYDRIHRAYVLAIEDALPAGVIKAPAVIEKLAKWQSIQDDPQTIRALQIGAGVDVTV